MARLQGNLNAAFPTRESILNTGTLNALNGTVIVNAEGAGNIGLAISGTYVGTITLEGSIDGTNWDAIPIKPLNAAAIYVLTLASAAQGRWVGPSGPYQQVRARMSAFTSGSASVTVIADINDIIVEAFPKPADQALTVTAAAAAAATLTLPAPGAGLYQHITSLLIERHTAAAITGGVTPIVVTSTNLPGSLAWSFSPNAAAAGDMVDFQSEPNQPLRASTANTAVTIVMPATTSVIWRATAFWYNAL